MTKLRRDLSLYGLTMVAIGSCIGSGIFLTPSQVAANLPDSNMIIGVWTLGGIIALTGALSFAELGGMFPKTGGVYVYLKEGYHPFAGFLYGWAYFTVINSGALAALTIGFAYYVSFLVPLDSNQQLMLSIAAIISITVINIFRVKIAEMFSNLFTGLKLLGIGVVILIGIVWGSGAGFTPPDTPLAESSGSLLGGFGLALVGVLWSYGGWQHASYLSGEAKNAERTIPRAMVIGATVVTITYVLANVSYLQLLPIADIIASRRVAADAIQQIFPAGASLVALMIALSTYGTALIYMLSAPRIYFAMADDGVFFKRIAEIHPRFQVPVNSVVLQSIWAIVMLLLWGTFEAVITYVTFTDWIFFTATAALVIVFRVKRKDAHRPYKTTGYPLPPIIFVGISTWFVINTLIERPAQALAGLSLLGLGIPVYLYFKRKR